MFFDIVYTLEIKLNIIRENQQSICKYPFEISRVTKRGYPLQDATRRFSFARATLDSF